MYGFLRVGLHCLFLCLIASGSIAKESLSKDALSKEGAERQAFVQYLGGVKKTALARGISAATIDLAFLDLTIDERVIGFDRKQPEFVQTFEEYLTARVTDFRRAQGRKLFAEHEALLRKIGDQYQVDPEYIVAFWGLETNFGRYQGKYNIIRSLATLGHDPRRSAFFTAELINALQILDEGHVPPEAFVGAWAGAMGQSQFMPSSFLRLAEDFDGDGRKDIWSNEADVFASIANYLNKAGWQKGLGWGGVATFDALDFQSLKPEKYDTGCRALRHHSRKMSLSDWRSMDVAPLTDLENQPYALVEPEKGASKGYLVGGNYRAILNYNCANKYAVSVGLLAEAIVATDS